jgi:DNA invertase Pin-like site-specific DNA recombinase
VQGSPLALLDRGLDLTTAAGGMVAMNLVSFAQYERELIGERTKAGLAAKKRRGEHRTPAALASGEDSRLPRRDAPARERAVCAGLAGARGYGRRSCRHAASDRL